MQARHMSNQLTFRGYVHFIILLLRPRAEQDWCLVSILHSKLMKGMCMCFDPSKQVTKGMKSPGNW